MLIRDAGALPRDFAPRPMPLPSGVLVCPPDHFDVVDVKNPFMEGRAGTVDRPRARAQWDALVDAFRRAGLDVRTLPAEPGLEDMVFCANPSFTGLDARGRRTCLLARMRHAARRPEVEAHARWFETAGWTVARLDASVERFEGGGDAIWHPGRALVWGGVGPRTAEAAYAGVAERFGAPVALLELATEDFYHLDTCFCPLDAETVLVYPPALTPGGLALVRRLFARVVALDEEDARGRFAGNAAAFFGRTVVLQAGCTALEARLRAMGYEVLAVETGEFLKSGGSVFCMKQLLW